MKTSPTLAALLLLLSACTDSIVEPPDRSALEAERTATVALGEARAFPSIIPLPLGFQPEGIVSGRGTTFFVGSLADGSVFRGDLRTGAGDVFVHPESERTAVGLSYDRRSGLLFVAGGGLGTGYVYDGDTGELEAEYQFTSEPSFINDVVVTRTAAYFTNSFGEAFYRVPLGPAGRLPSAGSVQEIPLSGDFTFVPGEFNANGIDATSNGKHLILVNSTLGELYRVDPRTGEAALIDLGGDSVSSGDGILLDGSVLYVVRNFLNEIAVVELNGALTSGAVVRTITSPDFRIPTTVDEFGSDLYAVNARFDITPEPDTEYEVVRVGK